MIKGIEVLECSFKQKFLHRWNQFVCLKLDHVPWYEASHRHDNQIFLDTCGVCGYL